MKTVPFCILLAASAIAHADEEIDVHSAEYLDVVETSDGSIWKGVVVEQTPNVQYKIATADGSLHVIKAADVTKISRQRNRERDHHVVAAGDAQTVAASEGVARHYEPDDAGMPAPYATSGLRLDPSVALVIPAGDIAKTDVTTAPTVRAGYEAVLGNFGIGGGGMVRYTYWSIPGMTNDAAWTLETMAYGRAALHISRVALHADASIGVDTNFVHTVQLNMSKTTLGLGVNVGGGVEVAVSRKVALTAGFDFHPGTDTIIDGAPASISYYAILLGAAVRL